MVLRCRNRVWSHIVIQQQNAMFETPRQLFPNHFLKFQQGVTVPHSSDGYNIQKVHAKVNASSQCKALSFPAGFIEAYQAAALVGLRPFNLLPVECRCLGAHCKFSDALSSPNRGKAK
ncbi:hypothetical protein TNCV_3035471 [Trichonephila clavipes]|nr:hypothetical protein TNCV_3035471 [Trichonephila clavipes]